MDLILIAVTAAAVAMGRDWLKKATTAMNIPLFLRSRVSLEKIATPALREKLRGTIREQLQKDSGLWANVTSTVENSLSAHVRGMARRTEVSIVFQEDGQSA